MLAWKEHIHPYEAKQKLVRGLNAVRIRELLQSGLNGKEANTERINELKAQKKRLKNSTRYDPENNYEEEPAVEKELIKPVYRRSDLKPATRKK